MTPVPVAQQRQVAEETIADVEASGLLVARVENFRAVHVSLPASGWKLAHRETACLTGAIERQRPRAADHRTSA
jgi:hypothetical protein